MRKVLIATALSLSFICQSSFASQCDGDIVDRIGPEGVIMSTTLPFIGFIMTTFTCRDRRELVLNLKEDASEHLMGNEKTELLQLSINNAKAQWPEMSEEEIVARFATMQFQDQQ